MSIAIDEAALLEEGTQQSSSSPTTLSTAVATKHPLESTISPPDTPGSTKSSPILSLKKSRMESSSESSHESSPVSLRVNGTTRTTRLSVVVNGASFSHTVNISAKYDRQIRIWGDHGQSALSAGCVYIIGHSMTASEVAKNLSLAGVGSLVFVDTGLKVSPDMCKRQALPPLSGFENRPFCDAMANWAKLFNPSATISCLRLKCLDDLAVFIHHEIDNVSAEDRVLHRRPSCVVICNPDTVPDLDDMVEKILPVPVISCTTIGMLASTRICLPPVYPIVETHVEYAVEDLRLLEPFPALMSLFELLNFDELSPHDRRSVPWPLIVLHYLLKMFPESTKDGTLSAADREALKQRIKEVSRQYAHANQNEEAENFLQAVKGLNAALTCPTGVPSQVSDLLVDRKVDESVEPFWLMCAGLREFIARRSHHKYPLPLRGSIPDISASTVRFVALQEAYRHQADADASVLHRIVLQIAQDRHVPPEGLPTFTDVQLFCRNAAFLQVIRGVSLKNEDVVSGKDWSAFEQYVALRALDHFCCIHGRLPTKGDLNELSIVASTLAPGTWNQSSLLHELIDCAQSPEVCAPVMGGIISHEAVKVITGQFVPINNALVYDGRTKAISSYLLSAK